jgi:hypothetical protein
MVGAVELKSMNGWSYGIKKYDIEVTFNGMLPTELHKYLLIGSKSY